MQQLLLAGWLGSVLAGQTLVVAAPGSLRAGSISPTGEASTGATPAMPNTYNPTLVARRQPQPMMAEPALPEEIVPSGPSAGMLLDRSETGSLLDELEPPKPLVPATRLLENPTLDDTSLAEMPAEPWSSGSWFFNGQRYAEVDFLVFERQRPKRRRELVAIDVAATSRGLQTYSKTFGDEPGIRATLGQNLCRDYLNRDHSVEFTFVGINQFQLKDGLNGNANNSLVTTNILGFNASDTVTTDQSSNFLSYEVNYRIRNRLNRDRMVMGPDGSWTRQYTHGHVFSFLFGLRHLTFDEEFLLTGRQTGIDPTAYAGDYRVSAENDLLGVQIGGELRSQYETWAWGVAGKGGAYVNFSEVNLNVSSATVPFYSASPALQDSAFLGELNIFGAYNLSPNWTLRSSLDLIGIAGVAQAPYNIDFNLSPVPQVNNHGFVMLVGMSFGMEVVW